MFQIPRALMNLAELDDFKTVSVPHAYPENRRTFYAPTDDIHSILLKLISTAESSLIIAMYGFTDRELAEAVHEKLCDESVFVQLTLDRSQANGVTERNMLQDLDFPSSCIAIGNSERGAIMHLKQCIIDGVILVSGSTNWSPGGQAKQDNELTVTADAYVCAEARNRIDAIHANILRKSLYT